MKCKRCGKNFCDSILERDFCFDCAIPFGKMVNELKLAYIHHYMHPEKKTIYVHDDESERHIKGEHHGKTDV